MPFEAEAANVFFQLVSARYERASLIVTSNNPSAKRWGEVFGDDIVAAEMIDRLVHHAEVSPSKATAAQPRPRPCPTAKTTPDQPSSVRAHGSGYRWRLGRCRSVGSCIGPSPARPSRRLARPRRR